MAAPALAPQEPTTDVGVFHPRMSIELLRESPLNPRRHFNQAKLEELAASIRKSGILTPLLARPNYQGFNVAPSGVADRWSVVNPHGVTLATHASEDEAIAARAEQQNGYELAAGHRRLRAAKVAQLSELPVVVREMSDTEFLEVLTIENLQREDVHPLEEAQGFADLIKHAGYDVARIAERVGRSPHYVYDRIRLLQLTPEIQEIFFAGEITAGHAILLARLSADDQTRALSTLGAVFTHENARLAPELEDAEDEREVKEWEEELSLGDRRKPMSVRELQGWIDLHVRFDVRAADVPDLFPETAAVVAPAIEQKEKVISITHEYHVHPEAKPESGERTYGPMSWKRADGRLDSKTCDRSVTGVIVVGPGRGQAFRVCVDKKKCNVHWAAERKIAAKRATGSTGGSAPDDSWAKEQARRDEQRKREEEARTAWLKVRPEILDALAAHVKKLPVGATGVLGTLLIKHVKGYDGKDVSKFIKPGTDAADLVRYLAFMVLEEESRQWTAHQSFPKVVTALGIDVSKILKAKEPAKTAPAKKAAAKKKASTKRGARR